MRPLLRNHFRLLPAAVMAALCMGAAAQSPSAHELEIWRAAHGIGTAPAYQAYLDSFPQGAFAALARAAIDKLRAPSAAALPSAAPPAAPAALPPSAVQALAGELETGVSKLALGERYHGPGVTTVGSFGSRRQVVLPAGEWIVLSGFDHRSGDALPVPMATLVFGQFAGAQLRSLLVVSFNRRSIHVPAGSQTTYVQQGVLPSWPQAIRCEQATAGELFRDVKATRHVKTCAAARPLQPGEEPLANWPGLPERLADVLGRLKAQAPGFNLRSEVQLTDQRFNYLGYTRLDCAGTAIGASPCEALPRAAADARVAWLQAFAPLALAGLGREIDSDDLRAGAAAPPVATLRLPD
jgi:hypothetical protein